MTDQQIVLPERLLRLSDVIHRVGLGKTMIYGMIGDGKFPKPVKITPAASRWSEREIDAWIVGQLHCARIA